MSEVFKNDTGCTATRSHITGDILCRWPGANCDCLMQRIDRSYAREMPASIRELYDELDAARERGAPFREIAQIEQALENQEA